MIRRKAYSFVTVVILCNGRQVLPAWISAQGIDELIVGRVGIHAGPANGLAAVAVENVEAERCSVIPIPTGGNVSTGPSSPPELAGDPPKLLPKHVGSTFGYTKSVRHNP